MRNLRRSAVVLAALLLSLPALARAQATVRGTVVDQRTGEPLPGARVEATGTREATVTNESGAFTLALPGTVSSLTVSAAGYATKTVPVSDASLAQHIALVPTAVQLPGISVVGSRPTPSVSMLSQHDLERGDELHLANSLNTLPGVFMQSRTPFGGAHITIRGYYPSVGNSANFNGLGYRVFLDGIPLTNAAGVTLMDDIDYTSLGNVEVIKGPASSEYGSYIGGTVLLTTKRPPPDRTTFSQSVTTGRYGLLRSNSTFQSATDRSDVTVNYGYQEYDSFRPHSNSRKNFVRASGHFRVDDKHTLSTFFAYNNSYEALAGEVDSASYYARLSESNAAYLANDSHTAATAFIGGVRDRIQISGDFTNETTLFGTGLKTRGPFAHGFNDANSISYGVRSVFGYSGALGERLGVSGHLGAMIQRSDIKQNGVFILPPNPSIQFPNDHEDYAIDLSVFTDWSFQLPQDFRLTVGAGLQKNEFSVRNLLENGVINDTATVNTRSFDFVFTPRVALTRELGSGASVYASVSSGYTPPLLSSVVASDGTVNLQLEPERAVQYEVGAQGNLLDDRLSGRVALYDVENTNKLVSETSNSVTFTTNAGKQRNRGVEASLSYLLVADSTKPISRVRPWLSYSYTDASFPSFFSTASGGPGSVDYSGNEVPRVPRNVLSAGLDVASRTGLYLNGTFRYVGKVPVTLDNSTYVRSYALLGLKAGFRRQLDEHWKLDLSAGADNLTGSAHYAWVFVGPDYGSIAQPQDGGTGDGYIIPAPYDPSYYGSIGLSFTP